MDSSAIFGMDMEFCFREHSILCHNILCSLKQNSMSILAPTKFPHVGSMSVSIRKTLTNPLTRSLDHKPLAQGFLSQFELCCQWKQGRYEHEMVDFLSGKSENTKWNELTRDIRSTCDVFREMLSELDVNASTIGGLVEGVTARMGRTRLEKVNSRMAQCCLRTCLPRWMWTHGAPKCAGNLIWHLQTWSERSLICHRMPPPPIRFRCLQ